VRNPIPALDQQISRRSLLKGLAGAAALGGFALAGLPTGTGRAAATATRRDINVWVWQFSNDGSASHIREHAQRDRFGVLVKTHDGTTWMSKWDRAPEAVSGPQQVYNLARFFSQTNTPFHAWCVVKGIEPIWEARMCADVLSAGAASIYLDLEPAEGHQYWQGTVEDAREFGEELRRLQPNAKVIVAPDARPWQIKRVPLGEFAAFANAIAPQSYWRTFNSAANVRYLAEAGFPPDDEGVTPELIMSATMHALTPYKRPVVPIGQGDASAEDWTRFLYFADQHSLTSVSVWRYGTADGSIWSVLNEPGRAVDLEIRTDEPPETPKTRVVPNINRSWWPKG
jgi:hypothetical protein